MQSTVYSGSIGIAVQPLYGLNQDIKKVLRCPEQKQP